MRTGREALRVLVKLICAALVLTGMAVPVAAGNVDDFLDVPSDAWYREELSWSLAHGMVQGVSETAFDPEAAITRGQFLTILGRAMAGEGDPVGSFLDVPSTAYYAPYVNWGAAQGIVTGVSETEFLPDAEITREQAAVILCRVAEKQPLPEDQTEMPVYIDEEEIAGWAAESVAYCRRTGILQGDDQGAFRPGDPVRRSEGMVMLVRLVQKLGLAMETVSEPSAVTQTVEEHLARLDTAWAVTYRALESGAAVTRYSAAGAPGGMVSASLIKLWIMAAVYDLEAKGELVIDNAMNLRLRLMIQDSDNTSANVLIDQIGMDTVNRYAAAIGCRDTRLNRKMLTRGEENYTSTEDCATLLGLIWNGQCVSPEASARMLEILSGQTDRSMISAGVLLYGATVYNKTGALSGGYSTHYVRNDAAIVVPEEGEPYILCIMTEFLGNASPTIHEITALSRDVYWASRD